MTNIYWLNAINGSFTNPTDWSGGAVPGASDDAILNATGPNYTVTSAKAETVESIQLSSNAGLNITAHKFTAIEGTGSGANAGTIGVYGGATLAVGDDVDNAGVILVDSVGGSNTDVTTLTLLSNTTFGGGGSIVLNYFYSDIIGDGVTLINVDNTISGSGLISVTSKKGLGLVNEAEGVIDASGISALFIGPIKGGRGAVTNDGLIEATNSSVLVFEPVSIGGVGGILVAGTNSSIQMVGCSVTGQEISIETNATFIEEFKSNITSNSLDNEGHLAINEGSSFLSESGIINNGTISVYHGTLSVEGAVTGAGSATIFTGEMEFDSSFSQDVFFFDKGGPAGTLILGQSQNYNGVITSYAGKNKVDLLNLDLRDIGFIHASEATFSGNSKSGVLTVTDGTHTARIKLQGDYLDTQFTATSDGRGGTMVVGALEDIPASSHAFIVAMAGLGGSAGLAIHIAAPTPAQESMLISPRVQIA